MIINLSPAYGAPPIEVTKSGDALTINGEVFDFSDLPEGAEIPAFSVPCDYIVHPVSREGGHIVLTLQMPYSGHNPSSAVTHPEPIIDPPDGVIALPADEPDDGEEFPDPPEEKEVDHVEA